MRKIVIVIFYVRHPDVFIYTYIQYTVSIEHDSFIT